MMHSLGVEVEFFSIYNKQFSIRLIKPKRFLKEKGEKFKKDITVGTEYNSPIFYNLNESFFLLKNGLRKFLLGNYDHSRKSKLEGIGLFGSWQERTAGVHIHVGIGQKDITEEYAKEISKKFHDHIPFLIALSGNSPFWKENITTISSQRLLKKSKVHCTPIRCGELDDEYNSEMNFNNYKGKDSTLEIRVFDSNIPEYILACLLVIKAVLNSAKIKNKISHENYLIARENAIKYGAISVLYWDNKPVTMSQYVDKFFNSYYKEIHSLSPSGEILNLFKYLKRGINGSVVLKRSTYNHRKKYPRVWKKKFASTYSSAILNNLNGNDFTNYCKTLGIRLPDISKVKLGRYAWK